MKKGDLKRWEDIWEEGFQIDADINLPVGTISVVYRAIETWPTGGSKRIGLSYGGSPIDGIELDIGGNYLLDNEKGEPGDTNPVKLGLGLYYNGDGWGVKTRTIMDIRQKPTDAPAGTKDPGIFLRADIMPWYAAEFAEIRCSFRITVDGDNDLGWHVNPYIVKQIGPCQFRAGMMLEDDNGDGDLTMKLPIAFVFGF